MSVTPSSPVIGVFTDRSMAEQAVEALHNAGFEQEQIRYLVSGNYGSFFEGLKSFFTGTEDNLVNDLASMGLSNEEARHYADEYHNGRIILAVRATGREQEALSILRQYGARDTHDISGQATNYAQQPSDSTPQVTFNPQTSQAMPTSETEMQPSQANMVTPDQVSQASMSTPDYDAQFTHVQSDAVAPEHEPDYQAPPANVDTPEQEVEPQATTVTPEQTDEFQQLQEQLRVTQQQLQEAKAQLQAAKEREAQLRTARERQQQLQAAKQQLQDLQTELAATQVELRETQARLAQYR